MIWELSWRADQRARVIADRHYSRQKVGKTAAGLIALQLLPEEMPAPCAPRELEAA